MIPQRQMSCLWNYGSMTVHYNVCLLADFNNNCNMIPSCFMKTVTKKAKLKDDVENRHQEPAFSSTNVTMIVELCFHNYRFAAGKAK